MMFPSFFVFTKNLVYFKRDESIWEIVSSIICFCVFKWREAVYERDAVYCLFESFIIFLLLFNTNIFIFLFYSFFKVKERIFGCNFSFDISFWNFKFIINSNRIPEIIRNEELSVVVTKRKQHLYCRCRKEKDFSVSRCSRQ